MVEKLYYKDQYLRSFSSAVTASGTIDGEAFVELERTAFFPEGGGQTSDRGRIAGMTVTHVDLVDGRILHFLEDGSSGLPVGAEAECEIDWKKRFSDMQQHTGEHIFSGVVHRLYGLENVGFHLGENFVTLDFPRMLDPDELAEAELEVNRIIYENHPVRAFFPGEDELEGLQYRSKKEISDELRLVEIENVDLCACCAPHVAFTGEVGIVKVIGTEKLRGGCRISILCGERAFFDISAKLLQNKQISVLLSEKETDTFSAVRRLKSEKENAEFSLTGEKIERMKLIASGMSEKNVLIEFCDFEGELLRRFADILSEKAGAFAAAFSGAEGDYRFVMISKTGADLNAVLERLKASFAVRGGGRNGIVQGSVSAPRAELESVLSGFDLT